MTSILRSSLLEKNTKVSILTTSLKCAAISKHSSGMQVFFSAMNFNTTTCKYCMRAKVFKGPLITKYSQLTSGIDYLDSGEYLLLVVFKSR